MLRFKFKLGVAFAIAAIAGVQTSALAQTTFRNPTHPTLSEVTQPKASPQRSQPSMPTPSSSQQPLAPPILSRGQSSFSHPPLLVRASASQLAASFPSTYEFTLTLPANAGQSLKAVTIAQTVNAETVQFDASQSRAFTGERFAAGTEIPLASVGGDQPMNPGEVTVVFEKPVEPGSTVTVAIPVEENPSFGGVYEFGITAYPVGEHKAGQFLGYSRISFYGNSN